MISLLRACVLTCLFFSPLLAADWPAAELHVGPSYLRIVEQDLLGGQLGVTVNSWKHVSFVGTFGYYQGNRKTFRFVPPVKLPERCNDWKKDCKPPKPMFRTSGIGDVYTYMGGLRLRTKLGKRVSVFGQGQGGIVRLFGSNYKALAAGGGAQVGITQRFAVEARVEYLPIRCRGSWLNKNVQAIVGVVVRFGPWWGGYRKP